MNVQVLDDKQRAIDLACKSEENKIGQESRGMGSRFSGYVSPTLHLLVVSRFYCANLEREMPLREAFGQGMNWKSKVAV